MSSQEQNLVFKQMLNKSQDSSQAGLSQSIFGTNRDLTAEDLSQGLLIKSIDNKSTIDPVAL